MNLSTRATNIMRKHRITDLNQFQSADQIFKTLRNCGRETASELWKYRMYLQAKQIRLSRMWNRIPHCWLGHFEVSEVMYWGSDGRQYAIEFKSKSNHPGVIPARIKAETLHQFTPARYDHVVGYGTFYL
jgi:hypothetical protein